MEKYFHIDDWAIKKVERAETSTNNEHTFNRLCADIMKHFDDTMKNRSGNAELTTDIARQRDAIIGRADAVAYYKTEIEDYIRVHNSSDTWFPNWYDGLVDAVYQENWGLAGLAEFFTDRYKNCSSAKIIGDDVFYMINGRQCPMPQKIKKERRDRLVRALCMEDSKARFDVDSHEVYMLDGSRITIYSPRMTRENRDSIIVRRYVIPEYTMEMQSRMGTIPEDAISFFKNMVQLQFCVIFSGAVRTAKTSFLATWWSYYNNTLEGTLIQTDPELRATDILPGAPVEEIIVDDEERMRKIIPKLLRSDSDYMIWGEARDGLALSTSLKVANKGTRGLAMTYHTRDPRDIPRDMAYEITSSEGGDINLLMNKIARSYDFIFHFIQLRDKSKKRLSGIYNSSVDYKTGEIRVEPICIYNIKNDDWSWRYNIPESIEKAGENEDPEAMRKMKEQLKELARIHPMKDGEII